MSTLLQDELWGPKGSREVTQSQESPFFRVLTAPGTPLMASQALQKVSLASLCFSNPGVCLSVPSLDSRHISVKTHSFPHTVVEEPRPDSSRA